MVYGVPLDFVVWCALVERMVWDVSIDWANWGVSVDRWLWVFQGPGSL